MHALTLLFIGYIISLPLAAQASFLSDVAPEPTMDSETAYFSEQNITALDATDDQPPTTLDDPADDQTLLLTEQPQTTNTTVDPASIIQPPSHPITASKPAIPSKIQTALEDCQKKQRQQAILQDFFTQKLKKEKEKKQSKDRLLHTVFNVIQKQLPHSSAYRIEDQRLIIFSDPILLPGKGQIRPKGQTHLQPIAYAMRIASALIPADIQWYWQVTGHADQQPLQRIQWFPSNWELSAARAAAVLRYFIDQGISPTRVGLAAFGNTRLRMPNATHKAHHAHNRRIEITLVMQ